MCVRQQALLLLNDVMHRRENLATALREGIVLIIIDLCESHSPWLAGIAQTLQKLLSDEDPIVRQRTASVLTTIARRICTIDLTSVIM